MSNANLQVQSVFNMTLSGNGPLVVPFVADFTTANEVEADLSQLIANKNLDFVSGAYIDNSSSSEDLIIKAKGSNQSIKIPAGAQAYMPLLSPNEPKFILSCATSPATLIPIFFYNIPLLPYMWPQSSGGSGGDVTVLNDTWLTDTQLRASPIDVAGPLTDTELRASPVDVIGPLTDTELRASPIDVSITGVNFGDFTLVLSGASEVLIAAGNAINYIIIQNPVGNNNITVNLANGDAATGIVIPGGGSLELPKGAINTINVKGTATETVIAFGG